MRLGSLFVHLLRDDAPERLSSRLPRRNGRGSMPFTARPGPAVALWLVALPMVAGLVSCSSSPPIAEEPSKAGIEAQVDQLSPPASVESDAESPKPVYGPAFSKTGAASATPVAEAKLSATATESSPPSRPSPTGTSNARPSPTAVLTPVSPDGALGSPTPTPAPDRGVVPAATSTSDGSAASVPTSTPRATSTASTPLPAAGTNTRLFQQGAGDIEVSDPKTLVKAGGAIELAKLPSGEFVAEGVLLSEPQAAAFRFNNLVLSWNAETPAGTRLEFQVRVGIGEAVSPWFTMGTWTASGGASAGDQSNTWGSVDVDTLELRDKSTTFQYKVVFTSKDRTASPRLRSVSLVYSDLTTALSGPSPVVQEGWARDLAVPQYSQLEQDQAVARQICSPTSLAMVLNFWGATRSVRQVYVGVRDSRTGIFGNWPLNTAYAGELGFDAYVDRFYSVEQLQNEVAQGRPVIISIQFRPGQLDNSPISSTTGHLIVVRGFTPQGDVIVNDPIAPSSSSVRRVYKRDQLTQVWLKSGGIVYLVRPG